MSMLDDEDLKETGTAPPLESSGPAPEETGYSFAGDSDLDTLLSEMKEEKQTFERPPAPEFEETPEPVSPEQKRRSNQTAEFLVKNVDKTISAALSAYAKASNPSQFYADPEDIAELAQYWGVYFQDNGVELPPWAMGTMVAFIVLSKKFTAAGAIRKVNLRLEAERKRTAELELQIKELTKQKEVRELEQQVKKLQPDDAKGS